MRCRKLIYIVILILLIINFVRCLKNTLKWSELFIFEIISIITSAILLVYYENLPDGYGLAALAHVGEVLLSLAAIILYSIIFAITLITKLIIYLLQKRKK